MESLFAAFYCSTSLIWAEDNNFFSIKFELSLYLCTCRALLWSLFFYFCINISILWSVYNTDFFLILKYMCKICIQHSYWLIKNLSKPFSFIFKTHKFPSKNVLPKALQYWQVLCKWLLQECRIIWGGWGGTLDFKWKRWSKVLFLFELLIPGFFG